MGKLQYACRFREDIGGIRMKTLESRLDALRKNDGQIRVMILGLGSVGNYLLNYLLSMQDERLGGRTGARFILRPVWILSR